MAQRLSFTEGGNITPEYVEEWTEKLSHALDTSPGWHKFSIYRELKQLKSEQSLLDIWTSGKSEHIPASNKEATTTHTA
jgi:hypothetical protein